MSSRALLDAAAIFRGAADVLERAAAQRAHTITNKYATNQTSSSYMNQQFYKDIHVKNDDLQQDQQQKSQADHHEINAEELIRSFTTEAIKQQEIIINDKVQKEPQSAAYKPETDSSTTTTTTTSTPTPTPTTVQLDPTPTLTPHNETLESVVKPDLDSSLSLNKASAFQRPMVASKVPSSRFARLMQYGGLAASVTAGAASAYVRGGNNGNAMLSGANVSRIVRTLSRMRGAALKLGQFLSIQHSEGLPKEIEEVLQRVQNGADIMPSWQCEQVLESSLGKDWKEKFAEWDPNPIAAASIGQVHRARVLDQSGTETEVAIKVQFPGVREAIGSDIGQLRWLLVASSVLPKGLFLENTLEVMKRELEEECDYLRELTAYEAFGQLLEDDKTFKVPKAMRHVSGSQVLCTEKMEGVPLGRANLDEWDQELRNQIGEAVLRLSLRELFHFRLCQTDPNWTNFLWNNETRQIELVDFGATRAYSKEFVQKYGRMLLAAIDGDRQDCIDQSIAMGYIKPEGQEDPRMVDAHVASMTALGTAFRKENQPFDFKGETITDKVRAEIPNMLAHRSSPPPRETYSLNRKLSGCFLLCSRLGSKIDARALFDEILSSADQFQERRDQVLQDIEILKN